MKKKSIQHRSIQYAISIQNSIFFIIGGSSLSLLILLFFINPFGGNWAIFALWGTLYLLLFGISCYVQFWYFFSYKASVLYVAHIHTMLYSSALFSAITIYAGVLYHTNQLNSLTYLMLLVLYACAYIIYRL